MVTALKPLTQYKQDHVRLSMESREKRGAMQLQQGLLNVYTPSKILRLSH